ncbi:hypothetical protein AC062_0509 [Pasteurellaceae bacterium NI1060]|nr:hypothetical protein AC062_0509 [Pasteurellaceae bacterium NI1060]
MRWFYLIGFQSASQRSLLSRQTLKEFVRHLAMKDRLEVCTLSG